MTSRPAAWYRVPPGIVFGCFAFVMATGIVSIAAGLVGLGLVSAALFDLNLVAYPVLWAMLLLGVAAGPAAALADLLDHRGAPRLLTVVAATCVLGNEIALAGSYTQIVAGLWVLAALLWLGLVYSLLAVMTTRSEKPAIDSGLDGTWLLLVVATEALSILTSRAAVTPPMPALFASLCLFLLGGAFYGLLLMLIVYRWLFLPLRPDQLTPPYWINMGAAAIATLAGTRLLETIGTVAPLAPACGFVFAATILFWSLATWWIPLLAVLTFWRHGSGGVRLAYRLDNWSIVFPLGMYTTATWRLAHVVGVPFLAAVPDVFVWIALAAWCLTFAGMVRAIVRWRPEREAVL